MTNYFWILGNLSKYLYDNPKPRFKEMIKLSTGVIYQIKCIVNNYFIAFSINLSNNSEYEIPTASNNFGYILILVNPGIVFISFI